MRPKLCNSPWGKKKSRPRGGSGSSAIGISKSAGLLQHDALGRLANFANYLYKVHATSKTA